MKKLIPLLLIFLFSFNSYSQTGIATLSTVESKFGAKKFTDLYGIGIGQLTNFMTKKVLLSLNEDKIYVGRFGDNDQVAFEIKLDSNMTGEVVNAEGKAVFYFDGRTVYQENDKGKVLFRIGEYNPKKMQAFLISPESGKAAAAYRGNKMSQNDIVLAVIALAQKVYDLDYGFEMD